MQENRSSPRRRLNEKIAVYDSNSGQLLGTLVNISSGGFLLYSDQPVGLNRVFQLRIDMPDGATGKIMELGAESLWVSDANQPGDYWTGFQIIDISARGRERVAELFERWAS